MRRLSSLLCALAVCALASPADAEPPRTSSLGWVRLAGAESCVGSRDLALAVEQRLGRAVFVSPAQAQVFVEGHIEGRPGFHVHLALEDEHGGVLGVRDLEAPAGDCRALDEQLALVIALLIDPDAALAPPGPPLPRPRVEPPRTSIILQRILIPMAPAPPVREPWRASVALGASFAGGLVPGVGVGASMRGEVTPPGFVPIQLGGAVFADAHADNGPKGSVVSLSFGEIGLCPLALRVRSTVFRGCAGLEVGAIRAVGYGFVLSESAEQAFVAVSLEGRVKQRLVGPLELEAGASLTAPLDRARFFYLDVNRAQHELFRMSAIAVVGDASLGVAFP